MNQTLFAHGCSYTHGSELVTNGQDPANTKFAFPNIVANRLNVDHKNLALPGASNEYIFHTALDTVYSNNNPIVLVCWSNTVRETWSQYDSTFTFNINYGAENLPYEKRVKYRFHYDEETNVGSYKKENIKDLNRYLEFFKKYKSDTGYYDKKLKNYSNVLNDLCTAKNIKFLELQFGSLLECFDISLLGTWYPEVRHPNLEEHRQIAENILKTHF